MKSILFVLFIICVPVYCGDPADSEAMEKERGRLLKEISMLLREVADRDPKDPEVKEVMVEVKLKKEKVHNIEVRRRQAIDRKLAEERERFEAQQNASGKITTVQRELEILQKTVYSGDDYDRIEREYRAFIKEHPKHPLVADAFADLVRMYAQGEGKGIKVDRVKGAAMAKEALLYISSIVDDKESDPMPVIAGKLRFPGVLGDRIFYLANLYCDLQIKDSEKRASEISLMFAYNAIDADMCKRVTKRMITLGWLKPGTDVNKHAAKLLKDAKWHGFLLTQATDYFGYVGKKGQSRLAEWPIKPTAENVEDRLKRLKTFESMINAMIQLRYDYYRALDLKPEAKELIPPRSNKPVIPAVEEVVVPPTPKPEEHSKPIAPAAVGNATAPSINSKVPSITDDMTATKPPLRNIEEGTIDERKAEIAAVEAEEIRLHKELQTLKIEFAKEDKEVAAIQKEIMALYKKISTAVDNNPKVKAATKAWLERRAQLFRLKGELRQKERRKERRETVDKGHK